MAKYKCQNIRFGNVVAGTGFTGATAPRFEALARICQHFLSFYFWKINMFHKYLRNDVKIMLMALPVSRKIYSAELYIYKKHHFPLLYNLSFDFYRPRTIFNFIYLKIYIFQEKFIICQPTDHQKYISKLTIRSFFTSLSMA